MMTSKEILLSYINTLSNDDCAEIYLILQDKVRPDDNVEWKLYTRDLNVATREDEECVKLTKQQFRRLFNMWGVDKLKSCINIYLNYGSKSRMLEGWNDYRQLTGWVVRTYNRLNRYGALECGGYVEEALPFPDITTKKEAKEYIQRISMEDRDDNPYVFYLKNKYKIEDIDNV